MTLEYDKGALVSALSEAVTCHFLSLLPPDGGAAEIRAVLKEAVRVVARTTAVLAPEFESRPLEVLREGERDIEVRTDHYLKIIMRPGSKAWPATK